MDEEDILPIQLIEMIQQYADGVNIYIPKKADNRATWGQVNKAKERILERDKEIYREYLTGLKMNELAHKYFLSEKSIQRIIRKIKKLEMM